MCRCEVVSTVFAYHTLDTLPASGLCSSHLPALSFPNSVQVLTHIADRLKDLHGAGYVHRDIKPGNIMWLPRTKRWTLIDFGCAARTGSRTRTGFSLYYAAPEALMAYMRGKTQSVATEALDAWSLGVLAIELLTGKTVFDRLRPREEVRQKCLHSLAVQYASSMS